MITGHQDIIQKLKALGAEQKLAHGYIFFGPERVGKCEVAKGLAKYLEGQDFGEMPEGKKSKAPDETGPLLADFHFVKREPGTDIGIDAVRELRYFLWQKPNRSLYRTVVIDESDYLTAEAQNALLKISEEPPESALIILMVSHPEMLAPTLASRFFKIYFPIVKTEDIAKWLQAQYSCTEREAKILATRAMGKPGLAALMLQDKEFQGLLKSAKRFLSAEGARSSSLRLSDVRPEDSVPRESNDLTGRQGSASGGELGSYERKDFVKKLIEPEDFNVNEFLEAVMIEMASEEVNSKTRIAMWHKILKLREQFAYFNLNPRIQLEALIAN